MSFQERILPSIREMLPEFFPSKPTELTLYHPHMINSIDSNSTWTSPTLNNTSTITPPQPQHQVQHQDFHPENLRNTNKLDKVVRFRRKKSEISRYYSCTHQGCQKSYGSLSHLNTHVAAKGHGAKRLPGEFNNLRNRLRRIANNQV